MLEEYPAYSNGLSRTAQQTLKIIMQGESRPGRVFDLYQETEERRFLGNSGFWIIRHDLLDSDPPLLKFPEDKQLTLPTAPDQALTITSAGKDVVEEQEDWLDRVELDRWIGGVHLTADNIWRWN